MKLFKSGSRVAIAWILSYIIVLLTPTAASVLIYSRYSDILTDQTEQFNEYIADTMGENIKNILVSVRKLYADVSFNGYIPSVLAIGTRDEYFSSAAVSKLLANFSSYNSYKVNYDNFYLYIYETDTVISDSGIFDSEYFYNVYFDKKKLSFDDWKKIHTKDSTGYTLIDSTNKGIGADLISYVMPLPRKVLPHNRTVSLGVMVNKDAFFNTSSNVKGLSLCDIYIFDSQGKLFLASDNNYDKTQNLSLADFINKKNDEGNVVLRNKVSYDTATMTLVSVGTPSSMGEVIIKMKRFSSISLIVCLVISAFVILFFMRRNYRPVEEILSILGIPKTQNEYSAMRKTIEDILSENKLLQNTSERQRAALRTSTLSLILKGSYFGGIDRETLADSNIFFKDGYYMVLSFSPLNVDSFLKGEEMSAEERYCELKFVLTNVFEELFTTEQSTGYVLDVDNEIYCVISCVGLQDEVQDFVASKANAGVGVINKNFGTSLSVSASGLHDSVSKLGIACRECRYTSEYKTVKKIDASLFYPAIEKNEQSDYIFSLERERNLINCVCVGDYAGAAACIDEVFRCIDLSSDMSLENAKFLMVDIAASILKLPAELSDSVADILRAFSPSQVLLYCDSISVLHDRMLRAVHDICEAIAEKNSDHSIVSDVIEYVHRCYADPDLNVSAIGEHFGMYPSYLSKQFREQSGEPLLSFINKFRIVKAKELMRTTDMNLTEIAAAVGYTHVRTFTRIYKQHEGVTPGVFKNSLK